MLQQELLRLEAEDKPIRVGASGAGWMGSGFLAQVAHVPGMEVTVLADADTQAAWKAFTASGVEKENIVEASSPALLWTPCEPASEWSPTPILWRPSWKRSIS